MAETQWLLDLASGVGDQRPVSWAAAEAQSHSQQDRDVVRALALIAQISSACQTPPKQTGDSAIGISSGELGRWKDLELLEKVGEGGFAQVYRAHDLQLDRQVALKLLLSDPAGSSTLDTVLQEARLLAKIRHPNIANVFGAAESEGRVGFWMEFVRGQSLAVLLSEQGPLSARETALIGIDLCGALAAVHGQGIVHRDVKADNVMREEGGRILLVDFGIGRDLEQEEHPGSLSGTPLYLAPEILAGGPATASSDIYSLGVLLFQLVSSRFPVEGDDLAGICDRHRKGRRQRLRDLRPDLPLGFETAVDGALAADPAERFETAGQLQEALGRTLELTPAAASAVVRKPTRDLLVRWVYAVACLILLLLTTWTFCAVRYRASPLAVMNYLRAETAYRQDSIERSLRLMDRSLESSPRFVRAQLKRSVYLTALGRHVEARQGARQAYDLRQYAGPRTASMVEHNFFVLQLDFQQAIDSLLELPANHDDPFAQRQLATQYSKAGKLPDARRAIERAIQLDPEDFKNLGLKLILLVEDGEPELAVDLFEQHRQRISQQAGGFYLYWGAGLAQLHRGQSAAAEQLFNLMKAGGGPYAENAQSLQARRLMLDGKLEEVLDFLDRNAAGIPPDIVHVDRSTEALWRAWIHFLLGDPQEAAGALEEMLSGLDRAAPIHARKIRDAAFLFLHIGDRDAAEELRQVLESLPSESILIQAFQDQIEGLLAAGAGEHQRATDLLRSARKLHRDGLILWSLGRHYEVQGEFTKAAPVFQELVDMKGRLLRHNEFIGLWPLANLRLARCQRELGREASAAASYRAFLQSWGSLSLPADWVS